MKRTAFGALLLILIGVVGYAALAEKSREDLLDEQFNALKQAADEASARAIEQKIWQLWMQSGNPDVDELMRQAMEARRWSDYDKALSLITQIIEIAPDYAEAWNQRATIHFLRGDFEQSLEYVATTLTLEPRHFGALAGRGIIRLQQGKTALAIQNIKQATVLHPFLRERTLLPPEMWDEAR